MKRLRIGLILAFALLAATTAPADDCGGFTSPCVRAGGGGAGVARSSADCAAETGGATGEACYDTPTNTLYVCESGPCDGAGWESYGGAAGGEINTGTNLGGGLGLFIDKSGVTLRFVSLDAADFDLAANLVTIDGAKWATDAELASHAADASAHHTKTVDASELTAGVLADARVQASNVTQHQAALTLTESQVSDLAHFAPSTLATDYSLFPGGNVDVGASYMDFGGIATPSNPGAGVRRLHVDSVSGELSVRTPAGSTVSLEAAGAGGGGDSIRVEDGDDSGTFSEVDSTADFDDGGDIDFQLTDGGPGGPDLVRGVVRPDSVALGTDTTGNYAAGDAEGGAALTGDSATAFFSSGTLEAARLPTATTSASGIVELATDGENAANVAVQGNDARLSDPRPPTASSVGLTSMDLTGRLANEVFAVNSTATAWEARTLLDPGDSITWGSGSDFAWTFDPAGPGNPVMSYTDGNINVSGTFSIAGTAVSAGPHTSALGFDALTTGTNTAATMTVGSGAQLVPGGTGVVRATDLLAGSSVVSDAEVDDNLTLAGGTISASALTLVQSTTPTPTADGRVEWDTDDDQLAVGTGAGTVSGKLTQNGLSWNVTAATCTGDANGGSLTVNGSSQIVCSADDGGGGGGSSVVKVANLTSLVDVVNTATETVLFSYTVPANDLGTAGGIRIVLGGDFLTDTTGSTFKIRVKFGGTVVFEDDSAVHTQSATRRAWVLHGLIANRGSASTQLFAGVWQHDGNTVATADVGYGGISTTGGAVGGAIGGTSSVDTTSARTLEVTVQWNGAHASRSFRARIGSMERLPSV